MDKLKRSMSKIIEHFRGYSIRRFRSSVLFVSDKDSEDIPWVVPDVQLKSILESYDINLVLDVGANLGQFAGRLRNELQYKGKIISFEPLPHVFLALKSAASNDLNWDVHNVALGNQNTFQELYVSEQTEFSSFLETNEYCTQRFDKQSAGTKKQSVRVRKLDELLKELVSDLSTARIFLKLDTQGYDLEVFKGLGDKQGQIVALQSEVSIIPIYKEMPHWTESVLFYERAGFGIVGMFPVTRDSHHVIEFDCLMVKTDLENTLHRPLSHFSHSITRGDLCQHDLDHPCLI